MKITVESTDKIVHLFRDDHGQAQLEARIWEGLSEKGMPVQCMIIRICTPIECDQAEFEKDLQERRPPRMLPEAFPLKVVL